MASRFNVPVAALKTEAAFYGEADEVAAHIAQVRDRLEAQNDEFELLLEYYVANRGRLDLEHTSKCRPGQETANLGTGDASWYYLDDRGNKIWVQNMGLDSAMAASNGGAGVSGPTGAFGEAPASGNGGAGDRHVVVTVPKARRHYALPSDFRRRCREVQAQDKRATVGRASVVAAEKSRSLPPHTAEDAYADEQRELAAAVGTRQHRGTASVYRPPANASEAERRLAMLREEEQLLWQRLDQ